MPELYKQCLHHVSSAQDLSQPFSRVKPASHPWANLHASGCPIWAPARLWELLRSFKLKIHIRALGRGTALGTELVHRSHLEPSAGLGVSSQHVVISCLVELTRWFCSGSTPLAFELSVGTALVEFVTFSWLRKCHQERITSNRA